MSICPTKAKCSSYIFGQNWKLFYYVKKYNAIEMCNFCENSVSQDKTQYLHFGCVVNTLWICIVTQAGNIFAYSVGCSI